MLYHMIRPLFAFCRLDEAVESRNTTLVTMILSLRLLTRREIDGLNAKSPQRSAEVPRRKCALRRCRALPPLLIGPAVSPPTPVVPAVAGDLYGVLTPSVRPYTPP
jgi:hypothetical protein